MVAELAVAYGRFAKGYYVKDGRPTSHLHTVRVALRLLRELYGQAPVGQFGPFAPPSDGWETLECQRRGACSMGARFAFGPDPGKYELRLECVGRNEDAKGIDVGLNSIRLRERRPRVKAFGYDKDKEWRTEQVLYD
jgi:hypothetical protein